MTQSAPLIQNVTLSHGTIECSDMVSTRRFLSDFLGIDIHRPFREAQYLYRGGPWSVVCVCVDGGEAKDQAPDNHFKLAVDSAAEVNAAHGEALANGDRLCIKQVEDVVEAEGRRAFLLQDLNYTWWELTNVDEGYYERIFDAGDGAGLPLEPATASS